MPDHPHPFEGVNFQLQPVQPPKPKASISWGLPIGLGLLTIPLLMFGFGFSQQQKAAESTPTPSATLEIQPSPTVSAAQADTQLPAATPSATSEVAPPPVAPTPQLDPLIDAANLPTASIRATNVAVNFRAAPSLRSQVLGVLMSGDLVQLTLDRRVIQDGVTWVPVRWRGQSGWIAQNFIGGQTDAGL